MPQPVMRHRPVNPVRPPNPGFSPDLQPNYRAEVHTRHCVLQQRQGKVSSCCRFPVLPTLPRLPLSTLMPIRSCFRPGRTDATGSSLREKKRNETTIENIFFRVNRLRYRLTAMSTIPMQKMHFNHYKLWSRMHNYTTGSAYAKTTPYWAVGFHTPLPGCFRIGSRL